MNKYLQYTLLGILMLLHLGCQKDKDEVKLNNSYTGILTLEYSRTFPEFRNIISMDVEVDKSGAVAISQPTAATYDATGEVAESYKIREQGSVILSSLSGEIKLIENENYLAININTLIIGSLISWSWNDQNGWINPVTIPFSIKNPTSNPHNFIISEAVLSGAAISKSIPALNSFQTYKWTLLLTPGT